MLPVALRPSLILCSDTGFLFTQLLCLSFSLSRREAKSSAFLQGSVTRTCVRRNKRDPLMLLRYSAFGVFSPSIKTCHQGEMFPSKWAVRRCVSRVHSGGGSDGAARISRLHRLAVPKPREGHRSMQLGCGSTCSGAAPGFG